MAPKKRAIRTITPAATPPAATADAKSVGGHVVAMKDIKDMTADEKKLICARGSAALKRFDLGVQRIKLNQLGISSAQRRLNIPHLYIKKKTFLCVRMFSHI